MNLPMYMLQRKKAEALERVNHYTKLYKEIEENSYSYNDDEYQLRKYYKDMINVYKKKSWEMSIIIFRHS